MQHDEPTARTTISLPASLHANLLREARVRRLSVSAVVRELVAEHVTRFRTVQMADVKIERLEP